MRLLTCLSLVCVFLTTPAFGQVQIDVRLEKTQYLEREPIVALVTVTNAGVEPIGYLPCVANIKLTAADVPPASPTPLMGCSTMMTMAGGCASTRPPIMAPGDHITFRHLLHNYALKYGTYTVIASGGAAARFPPQYTRRLDGKAGGQFERRFEIAVVRGTDEELERALAPYLADVDGRDAQKRHEARAALLDGAPPFLEPLIARIAAEDRNAAAVDALGRIGTPESREHLRTLFVENAMPAFRASIALALARVGHPDDLGFLSNVVRAESEDARTKQWAALGVGRIGGDAAVRALEAALPTAGPDTRHWIVMALGNTRSRLAVPVLIGEFGNDPTRSDVCSALITLTHRQWCDGSADETTLGRWQQWWRDNQRTAEVFGNDTCTVDPLPLFSER